MKTLPSFVLAAAVSCGCAHGAAPGGRADHTGVWTGNEMIIWGGLGQSGDLNDTWSYTPGKTMFLYLKP